ncbi:hypothetical protein HHI36_022242 [Cryptolaemus montrouzieri]|uniref:Uncharacterized protein n=1 Tax=Cryptolaemus montrouzieri TaxID=559131 RepID=A0ABD2MZM3_9CUCU
MIANGFVLIALRIASIPDSGMIAKTKPKKVTLEDIMSKLINMEKCYNNSLDKFNDLVKDNKAIKLELDTLKKQMGVIRDKSHTDSESLFSEINERMSRSRNIVPLNLKESNRDELQERIADDISKISEILSPANVSREKIVKVLRLEKKEQ